MSENSGFNFTPVIYLGIAVLGYKYVIAPIMETLGIKDTAAEAAQTAYNEGAINDYINTALASQTPTKTPGEWSLIADTIYQDLKFTSLDDNKADAGYQVCRVKNDADVALLFKAFGKRQEYAFGIPYGGLKSLPSFVVDNLTVSARATINGNYASKNIKFRY